MPPEQTVVGHSEACEFNSRLRRNDAKRRRVEEAVDRLIRRYERPSATALALTEWIFQLCRILARLKSRDDQDRYFRECKDPIRDLAERTANAPDAEPSADVAKMREFAAHMIRLEVLEGRNIGRGKAIEQASKTTWDELAPKERRQARLFLAKADIRFSSAAPGSRVGGGERHRGVEFEVMMAAAEMACEREVTDEAMARRIQRIRQQQSANFSSSHS